MEHTANSAGFQIHLNPLSLPFVRNDDRDRAAELFGESGEQEAREAAHAAGDDEPLFPAALQLTPNFVEDGKADDQIGQQKEPLGAREFGAEPESWSGGIARHSAQESYPFNAEHAPEELPFSASRRC